MPSKPTVLMEEADIERAMRRMASQILERNRGLDNVVLLGIRTRGYTLAKRLAAMLRETAKAAPPVGALDIGLYRDDLELRSTQPLVQISDVPFDIEDRDVILVDDVLYTGRTTRAALNALADFGRTRTIQLAVLVDRGHRELPIHADYAGLEVRTRRNENVEVLLVEEDGEDTVQLVAES